jgi:hypothetical protein
VQAGTLPAWRARRIAEHTLPLAPDAAAYVDVQVAPFAHRTGPAQVQRLLDEAIARHMPEHAAEIRERAAEARHCDIDLDQISFAGTARVDAELDLVDALDLEDVVAAGAAEQAALGSTESLDVRRAKAIGELARRQLAIGFELEAGGSEKTGEHSGTEVSRLVAGAPRTSTTGGGTSETGRFGRHCSRGREVVLYAHLSAEALRAGDREVPVWVTGAGSWAGGQLLTAAQVASWCGLSDTSKVTVKPVVDLNTVKTVDGYRVPDWLAEQVRLRDRTCVFPFCTRPAGSCDLDHVIAWDEGGKTSSDNLACLCRLHHRMKTHGGWTYQMLTLGTYLWHGPHGHTWLRDATGTTDLTPPEPDPPERRTS